jgi:hypothetical protein
MNDFKVGDYVIADKATLDDFSGITYVITGFTRNMFGESLVQVQNIKTKGGTVFYPRELSHES